MKDGGWRRWCDIIIIHRSIMIMIVVSGRLDGKGKFHNVDRKLCSVLWMDSSEWNNTMMI